MTRRRLDSLEALESRLESWRAPNLPEWMRRSAPAIIRELEAEIAARKSPATPEQIERMKG